MIMIQKTLSTILVYGNTRLHLIDVFIIILFLALTLFVGYYFSKRQTTTKSYFVAEGKMPSWAIGFSLLATIVSSITFLAYPGSGYNGNWILLVQGIVVAIVMLIIIWAIVPLYRNLIGISAYEYFEKRFGYFARIYSSSAFILAYISKMGAILYLIGIALSSMINLDALLIIWILGALVILLTLFGGIEAVIWLDVIQGFLLIAGGILVLVILIFSIDGGIPTIMEVAENNGRFGFGPFNWSFVELTFWVMAINGVFFAIQNFGTNQLVVQRFIAAKSNRAAIKATLIGILGSIPIWFLFMFIGTALFVYYKINPTLLPNDISGDAVFPLFIMNGLPVGITGLVVSALIASAFSSLDSELNSISAVLTEDFYVRFRKNISDSEKLRFGKIMVVLVGLIALLVASIYTKIGSEGVLGSVFKLYAIFSGGVAGMFLLGLFTRRANKKGLAVGIVSCVAFTGYAVLTSTSINNKLILDFGDWNFKHHTYLLGVYSHIIVFGVGYISSLVFTQKDVDENLTIYAWLKRKKKE